MSMLKPRARAVYFISALIALLCGAAIYPLFRGPNLLIWNMVPKPGFWEQLRIPFGTGKFMSILVYSGPDFLWFLSGILFLRGLWFFDQKIQTLYIVVFYVTAAGYNAGQYIGVIPGTFCYIDLLTMSGVAMAEGIIYKSIVERRIIWEKKG